MLAIVSDLHLTDETTANNVHPRALALLGREIKQAAKDKKANEVHVVLLGDVFDLVRTDYWLRNVPPEARPWGGVLDPATAMNAAPQVGSQYDHVLDAILATRAAETLIKVCRQAGKVTYVLGNHDRPFWNFASLRHKLQTELPSLTFKDELCEGDYGVLARHGHEYDDNCHGWSFYNDVLRKDGAPKLGRFDPAIRPVMALGEVITAELMSGVVHNARNTLPPEHAAHIVEGLKNVNNIRPMLDVFAWLDWYAEATLTPALKAGLLAAVKAALDGVLDSSFAKLWDKLKRDVLVRGDLVDRLQLIRALMGASYDRVRRRALTFSDLGLGGGKDACLEGAEGENVWKGWPDADPAIQYVVYGHTHQACHVTFEAARDSRVRMYINSGTMLPLVQQATSGSGFATAFQMTLAFFYTLKEDRRRRQAADRGPTVELWDGIRLKRYA
jgi:UDP-2,3-diacylglucosamine pyrophosphatase LpxH